jgi:hypothetical protein
MKINPLQFRMPSSADMSCRLCYVNNYFVLLCTAGLCYQDKLLYHLWLLLNSLGPSCGLKSFLDLMAVNTKCSAPEFQMLILFCDCMTHYVT